MEDAILGAALLCCLVIAYNRLGGKVRSFLSSRAASVSKELEELASLLQDVKRLHQKSLERFNNLSSIESSIADEAKKNTAMLITREEELLHRVVERKKEMLKEHLSSMRQKEHNYLKSLVIERSCEIVSSAIAASRPTEKDILAVGLALKNGGGL